MSCILRIGGPDFQLDAFLESGVLPPCRVFRKGEPRSKLRPNRLMEQSSANIVVSDANSDNLQGQTQDAIAFLKTHARELRLLPQFGVEGATLDFLVDDRDVAVQGDKFPSELLYLLGTLKIDLEVTRFLSVIGLQFK